MRLSDIAHRQTARITGFCDGDAELEIRLREIGFAEGDRVMKIHKGLFGGNPISVKLNDVHIALRTFEASAVLVELDVP